MRPLFEITQDTRKLMDAMEADIGDGGEERSDLAFREWAQSLADEAAVKLDGYVAVIKQLEMEAAAATAEMEQWKMKAQSRKAQIEWLKEKMRTHMLTVGVDELTTERGYRICLQNNGGMVPILYDEEALQRMTAEEKAEYVEFVPGLITTAVRAALEAGHTLSFARLGERGKQVRIRT